MFLNKKYILEVVISSKKQNKCRKCGKVVRNIEKHRKKPGYKGGKYKDDNVELLCHECHRKETEKRGEYEYGGKKKVRKLKKDVGEKGYKEYQSKAGKERQNKERKEIGEEAYRRKQRDRIMKRWHPKK